VASRDEPLHYVGRSGEARTFVLATTTGQFSDASKRFAIFLHNQARSEIAAGSAPRSATLARGRKSVI